MIATAHALPGVSRPFTAIEATWSRNLRRYQEIMARSVLVTPAPTPWPAPRVPRSSAHAQKLLDAERQVLGAVITGALRLVDLQRAPDDLCGHLRHRRVLDVLVALLEMRAAGREVPGAPGVDWRLAEKTCSQAKIWAIAVVTTSPPQLCSLLDLAQKAPRRIPALASLSLLSAEAQHRADRNAERPRVRAVLRDVVDDLVEGYLSTALVEAKGGSSVLLTGRGRSAYAGADVLHDELARHRAGRGVAHEITTDDRGVN